MSNQFEVVHASLVGGRPRRWYVYADSADRALADRGARLVLHTRPRRNSDQAYAIVRRRVDDAAFLEWCESSKPCKYCGEAFVGPVCPCERDQ